MQPGSSPGWWSLEAEDWGPAVAPPGPDLGTREGKEWWEITSRGGAWLWWGIWGKAEEWRVSGLAGRAEIGLRSRGNEGRKIDSMWELRKRLKTAAWKKGLETEKIERDEERPVSVSYYRCRQAVLAFVQPQQLVLSLSLSLPISLFVFPAADPDTNNFSLFISAPRSSSHSILLSGNKFLNRTYTRPIYNTDNRPASVSVNLSLCLFCIANVFGFVWR